MYHHHNLNNKDDDFDVLMLNSSNESSIMCDPTALLDLVPDEQLIKRSCIDYNEYTYCYGARGSFFIKTSL